MEDLNLKIQELTLQVYFVFSVTAKFLKVKS